MMRILCLCICLLVSPVQAAGLDFKMITLQHRFPQDILPAVQQLAGPEGTVTAIDQHLVVRATPERMAAIDELVERLDTARRNLRITVSHDSQSSNDQREIGVSGRIQRGEFGVEVPRNGEQGRDGINLDLNRQQNTMVRSGEQFLTVLDGERAFIRVGQSVPFTQQWVLLTSRYINIQQTTQFHDITTGFAVRPRYIGSQVELEVTPRIAQLNQQGYIDFEELTTTVRVAPGEWMDIGGMMQGRDQVSREILSQAQSMDGKNNRLRIKVD